MRHDTEQTVAEQAVAERIAAWQQRRSQDSGADPFALMAEAGLFAIGLPGTAAALDSYQAIALADHAIAAATGELGLAMAFSARQLTARFFIGGFADQAQRQQWLPRIAAGQHWAAIAISEPGAGAHPKHLQTGAEITADGVRLRGRKAFITNAPVADLFLVLAVVAIDDGRKRYGVFAVPRATPGLTVTPMPSLDVLAPASHGELNFDDCLLPADARIGTMTDAYPAMALPFRDLEDTIGTAGSAGFLTWLLRLAAQRSPRGDDDALALGRLAGLVSLIDAASQQAVQALDHHEPPVPARLIGVRDLARTIAAELRILLAAQPTDSALERKLAAFDLLAGIAREPRRLRQISLGQSLWSEPQ